MTKSELSQILLCSASVDTVNLNMDKNIKLNSISLTRRKAIRNAVLLLGGSISVAQISPLISDVAAMSANYIPKFLGKHHFQMNKRLVDLIIPESDTPGALTANVHQFIDVMLDGWAAADTQLRFLDNFNNIDRRSMAMTGKTFADANRTQQIKLLEVLDKESFSDNGTDIFFGEFKALVVFGYYSSEEGASVELRYDRIPGGYRDCIPFSEVGRSWST
ncbi:MAG: gluconate 2-dehydrogenase subunit 3 family protein [Candidatus Poseidoniia archaeon]|jgi:hypothetical protein|nr:gluconate 2-dehydrogenase subunit 3 family protein [Candidatus Poseidoniia archaeon]